jgi:hypothetical protein
MKYIIDQKVNYWHGIYCQLLFVLMSEQVKWGNKKLVSAETQAANAISRVTRKSTSEGDVSITPLSHFVVFPAKHSKKHSPKDELQPADNSPSIRNTENITGVSAG